MPPDCVATELFQSSPEEYGVIAGAIATSYAGEADSSIILFKEKVHLSEFSWSRYGQSLNMYPISIFTVDKSV